MCQFHAGRTWKKQLISKIEDPKVHRQVLVLIQRLQRATTFAMMTGKSITLRRFCERNPILHMCTLQVGSSIVSLAVFASADRQQWSWFR